MANKPTSVNKAGSKGGKKTLERYGREHFAEMGRKGGKATFSKHGKAHYVRANQIRQTKEGDTQVDS